MIIMYFNRSERFGLYHVDFNSTEKTRTPKLSAAAYRDVISTRSIATALPPAPGDSFRDAAWDRDGKGETNDEVASNSQAQD